MTLGQLVEFVVAAAKFSCFLRAATSCLFRLLVSLLLLQLFLFVVVFVIVFVVLRSCDAIAKSLIILCLLLLLLAVCHFCFHLLYRLHLRPQRCGGGWNDFLHLHLHFMFGLWLSLLLVSFVSSPFTASSIVVSYFVIRCCCCVCCLLLYCRCCCCCHLICCNIFVATTIQRSVLLLALPFVLPPSMRSPSSCSCAFMQQHNATAPPTFFRSADYPQMNEFGAAGGWTFVCLQNKFSFRMQKKACICIFAIAAFACVRLIYKILVSAKKRRKSLFQRYLCHSSSDIQYNGYTFFQVFEN